MTTHKKHLAAAAILILVIIVAAITVYINIGGRGVEAGDFYATYTGRVIGVYGVLLNYSEEEVCIESIEVAENVDGVKAELHRIVEVGGAYRMEPAGRVCIEPGGSLELRPGGLHIMIMGDRDSLSKIVEDGSVTVTIRAGSYEVRVDAELR